MISFSFTFDSGYFITNVMSFAELSLLLHMQMGSKAKAGEGVLDFLAGGDFPFCLIFGKVLQFGQYHALGTLTICKQES